MAGQVGARFLAESEIWRAWGRGAARRRGEEDAAVAPLVETMVLHMPAPVLERFRAWWLGLPSLGDVRDGQ